VGCEIGLAMGMMEGMPLTDGDDAQTGQQGFVAHQHNFERAEREENERINYPIRVPVEGQFMAVPLEDAARR
jgi:hypothetical protein